MELLKIGNVERIFPYTVWNTVIQVWNSNALILPLMVLDDTGQIATEVVIKVIEKYLEYLLDSLFFVISWTCPWELFE